MSSDEIIVSIGAKIDELIAGFNKAAEQVGESLGQIETRIATAAQTLDSKLAPAAEHASRSLNTIGQTSQGIGGALDDLHSKFSTALQVTGIAVAVEAVEKLKDALDETAERAMEFQHLGESVGVGAVAMQGLAAAADAAGISSSRLERTMFLIQARMQQAAEQGGEAAEKFNRLGISTEELGDSSFTAIDAMERMGAASNTNAQLIGVLGARGAEVIPMLRAVAQNHGLVASAATGVNALLPSEIAVMEEYHSTDATATTQLENVATRLLAGAVPALEEMVTEFKEVTTVGPVMQSVLDGISATLKFVVVSAVELGYAFKGAIDVILNGLKLVIDPIATTGAALAAV